MQTEEQTRAKKGESMSFDRDRKMTTHWKPNAMTIVLVVKITKL